MSDIEKFFQDEKLISFDPINKVITDLIKIIDNGCNENFKEKDKIIKKVNKIKSKYANIVKNNTYALLHGTLDGNMSKNRVLCMNGQICSNIGYRDEDGSISLNFIEKDGEFVIKKDDGNIYELIKQKSYNFERHKDAFENCAKRLLIVVNEKPIYNHDVILMINRIPRYLSLLLDEKEKEIRNKIIKRENVQKSYYNIAKKKESNYN